MKRLAASLFAASLFFAISPAEVHAADCDAASATKLPDSSAGTPIAFYGNDIGEESMALLWDLGMKWNTHDFGKAIAAEQNWFGACKYPGIGLGTGSGWSWRDRNVTLWIWADGVNLAQAANTIYNLVQPAPTPTTSTTSTTTVAPAPEPEPTASAQVISKPMLYTVTETTTTTTAVPIAVASVLSVDAVAPAVKVLTPAVKKKVVKKKVVKKKAVIKVK